MAEVTAEVTKEDVISFIENMSVLELSGMVKDLEEKFGVTAAAPVAAAGAVVQAEPAEDDSPSTVSVVLLAAGQKKIQVIKVVRELTGLGLKDAKGLVDSAPKAIKEDVEKEQAEELKAKLEEAGAQVELK